jgi:amidase/aspartyl-tRNA(Asn)/glutamyl-tRNA(Gln) amidotransferase subunit A
VNKANTNGARRHSISGTSELCQLGVADLTYLYRERELSPVEVTDAVLRRAEEISARYNAFVYVDYERARDAAKASEARWRKGEPVGPLDGVSATIKDLVSVKGWHWRMGSRTTSPAIVESDAPTAAALRNAGAILIGSTTTCEFGWKGVTDSPLTGPTSNPWNGALTPGGSSGGAAVAALTGAGVLHLGSDAGGSIRIPASFTGVFGHKPSFGRVPYFPPSAFGPVAHLGPIARTADDAALMLDVMSVREIRDWYQNPLPFPSRRPPFEDLAWKELRIGLWAEPPVGRVDPEISAALKKAARDIEALGATIEPVALPGEDLLGTFNTIWFAGAANRVRKIPSELRTKVDPGLREIAAIGATYTAIDYAEALGRRAVFGAAMDGLLAKYDLLISPATPIVAFEVSHNVPPNSGFTHWTEWASFNFPVNLSQQPACSLPMGFTAGGLPMGLQIVGPKAGDALVLRAAADLARRN